MGDSNQMESPTSTTVPLPSTSSSIDVSGQIGIAILVLAFVFGFPGNIFVVWSVLFRIKKRSVTCLLVLNLAVADAFVLLSAPLFLRLLAGRQGWEFGDAMCKTVHYLCCVNMYVSIYLICLMSMDRWLAVTRPVLSQRLRNKRTIYMAMLVIWVMAFLLALPMPFYRRTGLYKNMTMCLPYHFNIKGHEAFQYLFETLLGFVVPFTFIVVCYTAVICRLRSAMFRGRGKGSLLILLIIAAFAIFWVPYHLINILQVISLLHGESALSQVKAARPNVTAFAFLSSSVNPILYVFAGSSYIRRAGLGFMANLLEGTHSDHASSLNRRGTSTDNANFAKLTIRSLQNGQLARNKSFGEEKNKKAEMSREEELKTLTTVQ